MELQRELLEDLWVAVQEGYKLPKGLRARDDLAAHARTAMWKGRPVFRPRPGNTLVENAGFRPVENDRNKLPGTRQPRLIITVATGQHHQQLLEISRPLMERYARQVGADFIALNGTTQSWWGYEKFRVHPFARAYARTLFLDVDVIIRDESPDLFELVPVGSVGMHDDWSYLSERAGQRLSLERRRMLDSQGIEFSDLPKLQNSGVVLCSASSADVWAPPERPLPGGHLDEQMFVEHSAARFRAYQLPIEFNTQWWMRDFNLLSDSAHFVHFACCDRNDRAEAMRSFSQSGRLAPVLIERLGLQPRNERIQLATTLSPASGSVVRQRHALRSWREAGATVHCVQDRSERSALEGKYGDLVDHWHFVDGEPVSGKRLINVSDVLGLAVAIEKSIVVINSDIEFCGHQRNLLKLIEFSDRGGLGIAVRYNHDPDQDLAQAEREPYGLDVFSVSPDFVREIPRLNLHVGMPFWDYWLPIHAQQRRVSLEFLDQSVFFHQSHTVRWNAEDWHRGSKEVGEHYDLPRFRCDEIGQCYEEALKSRVSFGGFCKQAHRKAQWQMKKASQEMIHEDEKMRWKDGWCLMRGVVPEPLLDAMVDEMKQSLAAYQGELRRSSTNNETNRLNDQGHVLNAILNLDERPLELSRLSELWEEIATGTVMERAAELLQADVEVTQKMLFDVGPFCCPHQDNLYLDSDPPGSLVGAWVALEDIGSDSGRFYVLPRSKQPGLPEFSVEDVYANGRHRAVMDEIFQEIHQDVVTPEMRKGDVVFWMPDVIHGSWEPADGTTRRSTAVHYIVQGAKKANRFQVAGLM